MTWREFYEKIPLTPEEEKEAIFEGKIKKYFKHKHKEYWEYHEKQIKECIVTAAK
jgi:hypothetical protein